MPLQRQDALGEHKAVPQCLDGQGIEDNGVDGLEPAAAGHDAGREQREALELLAKPRSQGIRQLEALEPGRPLGLLSFCSEAEWAAYGDGAGES